MLSPTSTRMIDPLVDDWPVPRLVDPLVDDWPQSRTGNAGQMKSGSDLAPAAARAKAKSRRFILNMDPSDAVMLQRTGIARVAYKVPPERMFYLRPWPDDERSHPGSLLAPGSLQGIGPRDRLDIHVHGGEEGVFLQIERGQWRCCSPELLAELLERAGFKTARLIKFQACKVGAANYLERFKDELAKRGIDVGHLAAFTISPRDGRTTLNIAGHEFAFNPFRAAAVAAALLPPFWPMVPGLWANQISTNPLIPAYFKTKILRGANDIPGVRGTRYNLGDDVARTPARPAQRSASPYAQTSDIEHAMGPDPRDQEVPAVAAAAQVPPAASDDAQADSGTFHL